MINPWKDQTGWFSIVIASVVSQLHLFSKTCAAPHHSTACSAIVQVRFVDVQTKAVPAMPRWVVASVAELFGKWIEEFEIFWIINQPLTVTIRGQ